MIGVLIAFILLKLDAVANVPPVQCSHSSLTSSPYNPYHTIHTVFPEPNALGATFNKSLIRNISVAIGLELRALWLEGMGENHASNLPHVGLDCWSPTVNIGRDPRWYDNDVHLYYMTYSKYVQKLECSIYPYI